MAIGPHERFPMASGQTADLYLVRFGSDGQPQSPRATEAFLGAAEHASDVFIFSHGWNNTFQVALDKYRSFITGFMAQRQAFAIPPPQDYRPVMLGIIWPSVSFVLPWEGSQSAETHGTSEREIEEMLDLVAGRVGGTNGNELRERLEGRPRLTTDDARAAASLVVPLLGGNDPDTGAAAPGVDDLMAIWQRLDQGIGPLFPSEAAGLGAARSGVAGSAPSDTDAGASEAEPQGGDSPATADHTWDSRNLLRIATLWTMKSRAGQVGNEGLGPLLEQVLAITGEPRVHLIGHSFGARVLLSAVAGLPDASRQVRSMLLLQAAVNRWCFAPDVTGTHEEGGFAHVPARVSQPVMSTFSTHDAALTRYFHLALHPGEVSPGDLTGNGDPESHGALGGYGPGGLGTACVVAPAVPPGTGGYPLADDVLMIAIDGGVTGGTHAAISGHGDISNAFTWWALHCLVSTA